MTNKISVHLHREPLNFGTAVHIVQTIDDGTTRRRSYAKPVEMAPITPEQENSFCAPPPAWMMQDEQLQQFMDELWRIGFRPTDGFGTAGHLAAIERHLDDMRAIVFKREPAK